MSKEVSGTGGLDDGQGGSSHESLSVPRSSRASVSISLSLAIAKLREELANVAMISLIDGFVNDSSIIEIIPTIIGCKLAGSVTPFNNCNFLVPLAS